MKLFGLCATTLFFPPGGGGGRSSPEDMGPKSEGSWDSWGDNSRKHFKIDSREIDVERKNTLVAVAVGKNCAMFFSLCCSIEITLFYLFFVHLGI